MEFKFVIEKRAIEESFCLREDGDGSYEPPFPLLREGALYHECFVALLNDMQ